MMPKSELTRRDMVKLTASAVVGLQLAGCNFTNYYPSTDQQEFARDALLFTIHWSAGIEKLIQTALGQIPAVGSLLGALISFFWPSTHEDVWTEIKDQVEQMINQKIATNNYALVQDSLTGLNNVMADYLNALTTGKGDPQFISQKWNVAEGDFLQQLPSFQQAGYELLLLPLFAQFVNLHLTLLRDGAQFGSDWGWDASIITSVKAQLTKAISDYTQYATNIYQTNYQAVVTNTPADNHKCEPFRSVNTFVRSMTRPVLDQMFLWQYFDVTKYPNPVAVEFAGELYSDPYGTCDDSGAINLPSPPTQPITDLYVWAWNLLDGVQLTYPAGGGPNGVTQTARMGDQNGGADTGPPYGGIFYGVNGYPVLSVTGSVGTVPNWISFAFMDGTTSGQMGGAASNEPPNFNVSYSGTIMSSIHINGVSNFYQSADCIIFGFQHAPSTSADIESIRRLYVGSPTNISVEELAAQSVTRPVSLSALAKKSAEQRWDLQRQRRWEK